jgi:hypothetical protein
MLRCSSLFLPRREYGCWKFGWTSAPTLEFLGADRPSRLQLQQPKIPRRAAITVLYIQTLIRRHPQPGRTFLIALDLGVPHPLLPLHCPSFQVFTSFRICGLGSLQAQARMDVNQVLEATLSPGKATTSESRCALNVVILTLFRRYNSSECRATALTSCRSRLRKSTPFRVVL